MISLREHRNWHMDSMSKLCRLIYYRRFQHVPIVISNRSSQCTSSLESVRISHLCASSPTPRVELQHVAETSLSGTEYYRNGAMSCRVGRVLPSSFKSISGPTKSQSQSAVSCPFVSTDCWRRSCPFVFVSIRVRGIPICVRVGFFLYGDICVFFWNKNLLVEQYGFEELDGRIPSLSIV